MRLTDIFYLAERYLILGFIAVGLIYGSFCIIYFVLYKNVTWYSRIPTEKLAAAAVILCCLIVVPGA